VGEVEQSMAEERFCRAGFGNLKTLADITPP
jgi:hypothetical protein